MGIDYAWVNYDKKEYLEMGEGPGPFSCNSKWPEHPANAIALVLLIRGPWFGDRIAILNDCGDRPWDTFSVDFDSAWQDAWKKHPKVFADEAQELTIEQKITEVNDPCVLQLIWDRSPVALKVPSGEEEKLPARETFESTVCSACRQALKVSYAKGSLHGVYDHTDGTPMCTEAWPALQK